ncbi:hypothetical protein V6243_07900 [Cobetia marina]|uniref:Yip1 domain-containing protein n=1 Tax=Cobetia marina TaxID=28258 RepID=A0ABU9GE56_COBMA
MSTCFNCLVYNFKAFARLCAGSKAYDLNIGQAAFVFSSLAFILGFVSSLLEGFNFDPSNSLEFVIGFIAIGSSFLIVCICLFLDFLFKLFGFTPYFFIDKAVKAYLNVGTEVGILSALTTFFLGFGTFPYFYVFGTYDQLAVSFELIEYGVWFILIWTLLNYARRFCLGCRDKVVYALSLVMFIAAVAIVVFTNLFSFQKYFLVGLNATVFAYFFLGLRVE